MASLGELPHALGGKLYIDTSTGEPDVIESIHTVQLAP